MDITVTSARPDGSFRFRGRRLPRSLLAFAKLSTWSSGQNDDARPWKRPTGASALTPAQRVCGMLELRTAGTLARVHWMYRVVVFVLFALLLPGCSLGSKPLSLGFGESPSPTGGTVGSSAPTLVAALGETAESPSVVAPGHGHRTAKLDDQAPQGSFEKAPAGALADRDYSGTKLNHEQARDLINAYRRQHRLKPLKLNIDLTNAAKSHSKDLARWDRISHYGSDGSNPADRVKRSGYGARLAAENVGTGQTTIEEVFKGWQASPGHNKNLLLRDAEHMGIALVHDPRTEFRTFWTLVVGAPL